MYERKTGRRSTLYVLPAVHLDVRKRGYDEGEYLYIVSTLCDRHAMAGAEENPRHRSKFEMMADVAASCYSAGEESVLLISFNIKGDGRCFVWRLMEDKRGWVLQSLRMTFWCDRTNLALLK